MRRNVRIQLHPCNTDSEEPTKETSDCWCHVGNKTPPQPTQPLLLNPPPTTSSLFQALLREKKISTSRSANKTTKLQ